jgi:hypothetical protein
MLKTCFKCGEEKHRSEFYRHPQMGDGLLGKCKECAKNDSESRIRLKWEDPEWVKTERERCRIKQANYRKLGIAQKVTNETRTRWAVKNKLKVRAEQSANQAVRKGLIKKKNACENCSKSGVKLQKHHFYYSKPLEVIWLCHACHGIAHRKDKNQTI